LHSFAKRVLLVTTLAIVATDAAWAVLGHFHVDAMSYAALLALSAALFALGQFYTHMRHDPNLAAMLFGASFLCVFSSAADLLNYLLLTVAGHPIDDTLASVDRAFGFHWPRLIAWAAAHPDVNAALRAIYETSLPQIAILIVCLGFSRQPAKIYGFCIALAASAMIAMGVWTLFPSFGAFAVYALPASVAAKVNAALDGNYAQQLHALLANGPGFITPRAVKGLIGFPSFHTVMALLTIWYAREVPYLRWVSLVLNILVVASTPIHGGHHLVDILGGTITAALAIWASDGILCVHAHARADLTVLGPTQPFPSV
jgi:membrane-associated phospholipid phosphatase